MTETDSALVARVLGGEVAAYDALVRRHFRMAFAVARAHSTSHADAEDVCQDAFLRAYERLRECAQPDRFAAWLMRIVRNQSINAREHHERRRGETLSGLEPADTASPADQFARHELQRELSAAVRTLSPVQREVLLLHDLEQGTHAQIAQLLGISEFMSRRHLSDARRKLRLVLQRDPAGGTHNAG